MRKIRITLFLLLLFLVGCVEGKMDTGGSGTERTKGNSSDMDQIINTHGKVQYVERIEEFEKNVEQGNPDKVQVINYTVEGDPIYHTLDYDGTAIQFTYDTTMNQFESGKVTTMSCESIIKNETENMVNYFLKACDRREDFNILTVVKRG